ncbi:MAG: hypothetical protein P4N41_13810 [Negativicutes bacterium]|nr:hypothetical protein [Negativicutes bacterium]
MVKIFPARFFIEDENAATQLWDWIKNKVKDSRINQIIPLKMEHSSSKTSHIMKGLIEVHCTENITTSELEKILKPHPSFIHHIYFTFQ